MSCAYGTSWETVTFWGSTSGDRSSGLRHFGTDWTVTNVSVGEMPFWPRPVYAGCAAATSWLTSNKKSPLGVRNVLLIRNGVPPGTIAILYLKFHGAYGDY
jgi:hypothetical protein